MSKSRDAIEAQRTALSAANIGSSVQAYDADTAKLDVVQTYTATQTFGTVAVTGNVDGRDVSVDGTKLDGIAASANNYSHPSNHAISVVTGLQSALDAKVDDSQVLTNVPSGALFTDTNTVYTHPTNHAISVISGLQAALDAKLDDSQVGTTANKLIALNSAAKLPAVDGSLLTGLVGGGPSLGTASIIRTNANTISENITVPANTNGMTAGPVTISDGYTVTLTGTWSIV